MLRGVFPTLGQACLSSAARVGWTDHVGFESPQPGIRRRDFVEIRADGHLHPEQQTGLIVDRRSFVPSPACYRSY
ncbi:MAG: hypothetical protein HZY74_01845 [Brevundimonas sp.]|nr:MAG: hypothetical protein HZY74_01845 [Brevundimonas sp.]